MMRFPIALIGSRAPANFGEKGTTGGPKKSASIPARELRMQGGAGRSGPRHS
jgi:hypothetical protein